jgi:hypothetical protein
MRRIACIAACSVLGCAGPRTGPAEPDEERAAVASVEEPAAQNLEAATAEEAFGIAEDHLAGLEAFSYGQVTDGDEVAAKATLMFGMLTQVTEEYEHVTSYGEPAWSLAAMVRFGYACELAASHTMATPVPGKIMQLPEPDRQEVIDLYREQLAIVADPLYAKAREMYEEAISYGLDVGIDDDWTAMARDRLGALPPVAPE